MLSDPHSLKEMEACMKTFWNHRLHALKNFLEGRELTKNMRTSPDRRRAKGFVQPLCDLFLLSKKVR